MHLDASVHRLSAVVYIRFSYTRHFRWWTARSPSRNSQPDTLVVLVSISALMDIYLLLHILPLFRQAAKRVADSHKQLRSSSQQKAIVYERLDDHTNIVLLHLRRLSSRACEVSQSCGSMLLDVLDSLEELTYLRIPSVSPLI